MLVAGTQAIAASPPLSQEPAWRERVDRERAFLDPAWLALLAYRPLPFHSGWTSQADRPGFFLSPGGKRDPRAEMIADIEALFFSAGEPPGQAAACRFPARFTWLQQRLGLGAGRHVRNECPALRAWYETVAAEDVSIVFAAAFLESPSSTFGHTFLLFRRRGLPVMQAPTSNYEADSSRRTGNLEFLARGLLGGFDGIADQRPFFRRLRTYGDVEGRDLWEYPLRLDTAQVDLLLLALWEQKDAVFDYYFVGENCSYRTLSLLAVVLPGQGLLEDFPMEAVPVDTIRALRDRELLLPPKYWPSAVRTLSWHARTLSASERRTVVAIARGERNPQAVAGLPREEQARLLRAAAEYSSILIHRGELDFDTRDRVTRELIRARLDLDLPLPADPVEAPAPPDLGHEGRMLSLAWAGRRSDDTVELGFSGFQHERIDRLAGYERNAELVVLGMRYGLAAHGGGRLEHLDLLRLEASPPSDRFFQQPAWALRIGAVRKHVDQGRPLLGAMSYSRGRAYDIGPGVLALMMGGSLDSSPALRGGVALEAVASARLTRQMAWLGVEAFVEHGRYVFGDHSHRLDYGARLGVPLSRDQGLVVEFQRGGADSQENLARVELRSFF